MSDIFSPGSLVRARGREWVVLPESSAELMLLQPLGGAGEGITGIYLPGELETVEPAAFAPPDPEDVGDARSSRLLREAVRLGFRNGAGPFRSFGHIAVEPRPYQLVPLLLALQLDPVRLLIADDVGIGKSVEAGLIARELLDRGEISRVAVLCPPHLAEQWVAELSEKFNIEAVPVLPTTVRRLESSCGQAESLFDHYPFTVVSLDFIKTDRHADDFIAHCPAMVIVDEAHTCAQGASGVRQLRYRLLKRLAADAARHLILVSATPHSGNTEAFRSLLALLRSDFESLPDDLSGTANAERRRAVARHMVQRRRVDIAEYLSAETPFPKREPEGDGANIAYSLTPEYKKFFDRVLAYAREIVKDDSGGKVGQRVRWWAALGLLRALASSPAAAAATLQARANNLGAGSPEEADVIGRRNVLDLDDDTADAADLTPGAQTDEEENAATANVRRLREMAREAEKLAGTSDRKLQEATAQVRKLLDDGFAPIVFCRFINTADYLAAHLKAKLKGVEVVAVSGMMNPDERLAAILELARATQDGSRRVLVATDCLSEGINLQAYFNSVLHYDLPWNPTRLEQRDGRVDRFGQLAKVVRSLTLYGRDNQIDGIVLSVLLRKHREIRRALGISVPVPDKSDAVIEAIFEGLLLRGRNATGDQLTMFDDMVEKRQLDNEWDAAVDREKRSRTVFAHEGIRAEDVEREVKAMRNALGGSKQVEGFVRDSLAALGHPLSASVPSKLVLKTLPEAVQEPLRTALPAAAWKAGLLKVRFDTANAAGETLLGRTHPLVAVLASHLLETALDGGESKAIAARCGAMRTAAVAARTTLLLTRMRFHLHQRTRGGPERAMLAEECVLLAFRGAPEAAQWLDAKEAEALLQAVPAANMGPDQAAEFVRLVTKGISHLRPALEEATKTRAAELLQAHRRVRDATRSGGSVEVKPQPEPDLLGVWVFVPVSA